MAASFAYERYVQNAAIDGNGAVLGVESFRRARRIGLWSQPVSPDHGHMDT
jgi:hypothetical protein